MMELKHYLVYIAFGNLMMVHAACKILNIQGLHGLEKYLNIEIFLEKSLKIKYALKSTGKSLKCLEQSLNSSIFCRT